MELLTAAIFMVLFVRFRIGLEFASYAVLSCFLIVAAFIDLNTMEIPDSVTIPGTMAGLMFSGFLGTAPKALLGAALGLGLLSVISFIGKRAYKREVMGDGDAMLLMMIGAGLGFAGAITSIFLSFFIGGAMAVVLLVLRVRKFGEEIPFGPMIALGAGLYIFYGDAVIMWYLRLLGFL